ncbi:1-(5-phosphoribosyl)-5-[(5-phosphoribosylamino)methylideneamino] imidazole-4-carboxamide isomerase [Hymenobacter sp. BT770]|uniref:1-(5-phosphoribosyl)-5-[(5- phosphoribosylamino)methylideneamino]imidazole-4- carboxamide isomerase n=1 Tax=Hymenobacter sp. BT770 TaxID=2886942 RepID=UPI001D1295FB|nr:1-(5-phosphoribosyl)-5-[(5-phosphoribosylamino)methylideneamino] imidazole-4-carboxamide isomerase [Hymenobacter sp. BT770]MCC3152982.1 1-(5-phosphoribosyl)-5-[(5-phosphoribosylamino)methylideneamino] imidazole-4-carboxamide isomerase [Hymenobacter sp. BT770]MDO3415104.1 1-(5-phosphoribosyl)-5-[(5-phosphoribosylamino)methylideneamino] imidazole-4-carboxamide isomerase [Hymenobacter sp. BT770]
MEIIPAIDLMNGQCVRLSAGDFARQTTYDADPVAVAQRFADAGVRRLHLVDLDGARSGHPVNLAVLEAIARHTTLDIDAGGGIQTHTSLTQVFNAGASHITAGSLAVREQAAVEGWLELYGADKIFLGADFKGEHIMINAWAEQSPWTLAAFIESYLAAGGSTFICTDVSKDGLLQGPSLATYKALVVQYPDARFIASGGVTTVADLEALSDAGMHGAIIGKALYEGTISLPDLQPFL